MIVNESLKRLKEKVSRADRVRTRASEYKETSGAAQEATGSDDKRIEEGDLGVLVDRIATLEDILFNKQKFGYLSDDASLVDVIRKINSLLQYINRDLRR
jgi:hypothetical protein